MKMDREEKRRLVGEITERGYSTLDAHAAAIRELDKRAGTDVFDIGRRLTECKQILARGSWLPWLEREFGYTEQTALNFMRVYERFKSKTVLDLGVPLSGLYLLARPSTPEAAVDEVMQAAEQGEKQTLKQIKQTIAEHKPEPDPDPDALEMGYREKEPDHEPTPEQRRDQWLKDQRKQRENAPPAPATAHLSGAAPDIAKAIEIAVEVKRFVRHPSVITLCDFIINQGWRS
jgi:Protein of unknown function (DUF3102)